MDLKILSLSILWRFESALSPGHASLQSKTFGRKFMYIAQSMKRFPFVPVPLNKTHDIC